MFLQDPVLTGLPGTYQSIVDEDAVPAQLLHTFSVTDSDDTISCAVDPASPEAAIFEVVAGTAPGIYIPSYDLVCSVFFQSYRLIETLLEIG